MQRAHIYTYCLEVVRHVGHQAPELAPECDRQSSGVGQTLLQPPHREKVGNLRRKQGENKTKLRVTLRYEYKNENMIIDI